MSTELGHTHLKIERAKKHIADAKTAIFTLENSHTPTIQVNQHGATELIHEIPNCESQLLNLSLIVGDALHNLHTALDFAWASVISQKVPEALSNHSKFPFRANRASLEGSLHGIKVDARCPALFRTFMDDIQPYNGGKGARLCALHELDILDKHLLLLGLAPTAGIKGISVRDKDGQIWRGNAAGIEGHRGPQFGLTFESGIEVQDKGKIAFNITIKEAGIFENIPVLELLSTLLQHVTFILQLLESI